MKLLKNPLFKIVGIVVILYLTLFNKEKENSLGNRISSEKVKENLSYIKDKTIYIKENLNNSKKYKAKQKPLKDQQYQDFLIGIGKYKVNCGDTILAKIIKLQGEFNIEETKKRLQIDRSTFNSKFIGMKKGGRRRFLSQEFISGEITNFTYDIELLDILTKNDQKNDKNC